MSPALPAAPVYIVDLLGSAVMIAMAFAAIGLARRLSASDPRNLMWSFLFILAVALGIFSLGRGIGHIVKIILLAMGQKDAWAMLSPLSGSINTIAFVIIAAATFHYSTAERMFQRMTQANEKLGEALDEIRRSRDLVILLERRAIADKVSSTLAHETRNPIFTIASFARGLKKKLGDQPEIMRRLNVILEESSKLEGLVDGILKSRYELPKLQKSVEANHVLDAVVQSLEDKSELAGVRVKPSPAPVGVALALDPDSVQVALREIVSNAIEASEQGGEVALDAFKQGGWLLFQVTDHGVGIPPEIMPRLFEPLFSTKELSTGLGLSFAKDIIEANGGYLKFASEPGKGTIFTVYFPLSDLARFPDLDGPKPS